MRYTKIKIFVILFFCTLVGGCQKEMSLNEKVQMSFLPCKDADVTVIEHGDHIIFIDTGEATCQDEVLSYLKEKNVDEVDLMVLTHPDKDHIGNAVAIMKNWNVKKVYATNYKKESAIEEELLEYVEEHKIDYEVLTSNKNINIGELQIQLYAPLKSYDSSNNSSLITFVKAGNITTFFGADVKKSRIEELLKMNLPKSSIVKLPYHGRYVSNMGTLLKKLSPEFVVITAIEAEDKTKALLNDLELEYDITTDMITIEIDGLSWTRK